MCDRTATRASPARRDPPRTRAGRGAVAGVGVCHRIYFALRLYFMCYPKLPFIEIYCCIYTYTDVYSRTNVSRCPHSRLQHGGHHTRHQRRRHRPWDLANSAYRRHQEPPAARSTTLCRRRAEWLRRAQHGGLTSAWTGMRRSCQQHAPHCARGSHAMHRPVGCLREDRLVWGWWSR